MSHITCTKTASSCRTSGCHTVFKTLKGVLSFIIIWYNEMSTNPGFNISVDIKCTAS